MKWLFIMLFLSYQQFYCSMLSISLICISKAKYLRTANHYMEINESRPFFPVRIVREPNILHNWKSEEFCSTGKLKNWETDKMNTCREPSMKNLLMLFGILLIGGSALTARTNPLPPNERIEFLLFLAIIAGIYYLLLGLYFLGGLWRKLFFILLLTAGILCIFMSFYLAV